MNPNRKAELQRKLSMTSVPKPPAGLADRIKADIPRYLQPVEAERDRFTRSIAFNLRVAASILLLVSGLFAIVHLMTRDDASSPVAQTADVSTKRVTRGAPVAAAAPVPEALNEAMDELRVEITESAATTSAEARPQRAVAQVAAAEAPRVVVPASRHEETANQTADAEETRAAAIMAGAAPPIVAEPQSQPGAVAGGVAGGVIGRVDHPQAIASAPAAPAAEMRTRDAAAADSFAMKKPAQATAFAYAAKEEVFGISVDPGAFETIKSTIESGEQPSADDVNLEALVNYFAGGAKTNRRDVRLEVEGSPSPVKRARGVLRFTVDTAASDARSGNNAREVAKNAQVVISIDNRAVADIRRLGGGEEFMADEATLLTNTSVTALYEIELKPALSPRQRVATVTLTYTSVVDGREKTLDQTLFANDFRRRWSDSSRRHRLASLGAVWGETLRGMAGAPEVARQAEALATEEPRDERARELAKLSSASSKIHGVPTGSGK